MRFYPLAVATAQSNVLLACLKINTWYLYIYIHVYTLQITIYACICLKVLLVFYLVRKIYTSNKIYACMSTLKQAALVSLFPQEIWQSSVVVPMRFSLWWMSVEISDEHKSNECSFLWWCASDCSLSSSISV